MKRLEKKYTFNHGYAANDDGVCIYCVANTLKQTSVLYKFVN